MVNWNVTVAGTTITKIFDIQYNNGETTKMGEASIVCANNSNNRNSESGDELIIKKNGTKDFVGYITGKPSKAGPSATELELKSIEKRSELKHEQVNRTFYQKDTGNIIKEVLNNKLVVNALDNEEHGIYVDKGESTTNWNTNVPKFRTGDIASLALEEGGNNFLFFGWPEKSGTESPYNITYTNVPSDALVGDGQLDTLYARMALNNNGGIFNVELDIRDFSGNNFIWPLELPESGFKTHELKAANATTTASIGSKLTNNGRFELRVDTNGTLPDSRALGLDFVSTIPYRTESRSTDITPTGVETTGNVITRRIEKNILQMIEDFATEDGYIHFIDTDDVLYYHPSGQTQAKSIEYSSTNVVDADFDRDYRNITNRVTVQGDSDVRVTVEDTASIEFYGVSAREKPIVDEELQTEKEAERRGKGFIKENAWDDEAFVFVVADASYQSVRRGDDILVKWSPENINATYTVSNVETDKDGLVTITVTKRGTL